MHNALPPSEHQATLTRLLHMLAVTEERELSCEEVFELVDYCAELQSAGIAVQDVLPAVANHLRLCADCADEYRALLRCLGMAGDETTATD
ncbi:MAG: hypothetical protein RMN24_06065 [Anaerolineae bacterium]|nr:hypothetical protein [Caldilineales bacterium]MDW8268718.1 hypothetical protein [Anaerolineae bacterium]